MGHKILLVAPPIYDFTAFDFWVKPYGLLNVAGRIDSSRLFFFDFLGAEGKKPGKDFGRGKYLKTRIGNPKALQDIPRPYNRFGAPKESFSKFLKENGSFDVALIGSMMTYWYPGVKEVADEIRRQFPKTVIIVGGIYATLCPGHAASLDVDLVIEGNDLAPLKSYLSLKDGDCLPMWSLYPSVGSGVMKISRGCPYSCTYCASKMIDGRLERKTLKAASAEYLLLLKSGARDIAFYDDALLYDYDNSLSPFLDIVLENEKRPRFHTPNGLHLRYLTRAVAKKLVKADFRTFFLSLETVNEAWHLESDRKAGAELFECAADNLISLGADRKNIAAYLLMGHPKMTIEMLEETLFYLSTRNIRPSLSEFSPIPGTPDGDLCGDRTDLNEPLNHNKMAWTIRFYGENGYQQIKELANRITRKIM
jgi:hypothetical protein